MLNLLFIIIILFIQGIQSYTAKLGCLIIADVVLLWSNGWIKVPAAFRLWIPKEKCETYHTKVEPAMDMTNFAHNFGLLTEYVSFDTWYSSKAIFAMLKKCNYHFCCKDASVRGIPIHSSNFYLPIQIPQVKNNLNIIDKTTGFLHEFVQVKVDNIICIINLSSKDSKCKDINTISISVATTI